MSESSPPPSAEPDRQREGFAALLRAWRTRRRFSQQQLSLHAGVSARHLSFLETGRAQPSRTMVLTLADHLDVPLRERNELLTAAGFAPSFPQRDYDAPEMATIRTAVDQVLAGHDPFPALAVDRAWNVVATNGAVDALLGAVDDVLLGPPTNVYRLTLHPDGLAPLVIDFAEVAHHLLARLRHDADVTGDAQLHALLAEVEAYPTVRALPRRIDPPDGVVVPFRLRHPHGELSMFTTITTFGTPADVTVAELALELFYPLDPATAERLAALQDR